MIAAGQLEASVERRVLDPCCGGRKGLTHWLVFMSPNVEGHADSNA